MHSWVYHPKALSKRVDIESAIYTYIGSQKIIRIGLYINPLYKRKVIQFNVS